jgi:prephenate dehydrogenase
LREVIGRLAIVGVGLLGGSVAKATRARGGAREIVGIGRDEGRLSAALRDGTLDRITTDLAAGVRGADLVVLAAPVFVIERQLEVVASALEAGALLTDVGSTKASIVEAGDRLAAGRPFHFVGSHPMAGSERAGYAVARPDLFEGATVIVTPTGATAPRAVQEVSAFWEGLGGRVRQLDPATHDRVVAAISHLPHLTAFATVAGAHRFQPAALAFAARGFRDTTRVAASDPVVWQEIFHGNREALLASVRSFRAALDEVERLVAADDAGALQAWLAEVKDVRETVR